MTAQQITMHPIWQQFQRCLSNCVNSLLQQGQMTPQESTVIQQMLTQAGPGTMNFINSLTMRYQQIDDNAMCGEIMTNFLPSVRQAAQQRLAMMGGAGGGMGMPGYGMTPGVGAFGAAPRPMGFGYGNPPGPGVFQQGNPNPFSPAPGSAFSGPGSQMRTSLTTPQPQPQQPKPKVAPFAIPQIVEDKTATINECVVVKMAKFALTGDRVARRIAVFDPRVRYANDLEAINAFRSIFNMYKKTDHKFLMVGYKQLKVINWNRDEFSKLAQNVAIEVTKHGTDLESRLRAIVTTMENFPAGCMKEYNRIVMDEFDAHVKAGALCDSAHPTNILGRLESVQSLLDIVTGDIDKDMLAALKSMRGFEERFVVLVSRLINDIIVGMPKSILDPIKNRTLMDDYSKILPQVWSIDGGNTWNGTPDLFDLFLTTRETIMGSKTDTATKAESELNVKLHELHSHFCVLQVPRVACWCDYPKSVAVSYKDNGDCVPYVSELSKVNNELGFFCAEVLSASADSRAALLKFGPKSVYCECDEETFALQFDFTTDDAIWLGTSMYWK